MNDEAEQTSATDVVAALLALSSLGCILSDRPVPWPSTRLPPRSAGFPFATSTMNSPKLDVKNSLSATVEVLLLF